MPETNRDEIAKLEALYAGNPEGRVFTHLAEAYRKAGEFDRARAILEQGLGKHPGYASAYVVLGRVFFDLTDMQQATDSFRRVLELDPHNLVALRSLGDIERAAGHRDEALGYFQELRHLDPNNSEIEAIIADLRGMRAPPPSFEPEVPAAPAYAAETFETAEPEPAETGSGFTEFEAAAEPEPEPIFDTPSPFDEVQPVAENLPEFDVPAPDFSDLVAPDIDIDWSGETTEADAALPGDLAEFADMLITSSAQDAFVSEPAEELPILDFPDVELDETIAESAAPAPEPEPEPEPEFEPSLPPEPEWEPEVEPAVFEAPLPAPSAPAVNDELVTETMARLYRDQGLYDRSAQVYRVLLAQRPGDWSLQAGLHEVERLASEAEAQAAPEAPPAPEFAAEPVEPPPFITTAPEAALPESPEPEEELLPTPWMSGTPPASEAPSIYNWAEEPGEASEEGAPIADYFKSLLSWRPHGNGAQSGQAPAPHTVEEPAMLELDVLAEHQGATAFEEPILELQAEPPAKQPPVAVPEPPAIPPDELMPWEEPASPSMPDAPVVPVVPPATPGAPVMPVTPPAPRNALDDNPVDAAFDEWFNSATPAGSIDVDPLPAPQAQQSMEAMQTQPPAPTMPNLTPSGDTASDSEDDDDLEMFRSWLQSLKK